MKMKRLFYFVLIAVAVLPLAAQSSGSSVFAPFVSRLEGELKNNLVRLSWVDSPDVRGPVYIYRSPLPFEKPGPFRELVPVEIPYGAQSYIDEIETGGMAGQTLYYLAAASDEAGRSYEIPIVFTNTIGVLIPGEAASQTAPQAAALQEAAPSQPEPVAQPAETPAGISSLEAAAKEDGVMISFTEGDAAKNTVLYRSVQPIRQTPDLLGAVIVKTRISSPFTDYPVPGIPYYYALIFEEDLVRGTVKIMPGQNSTLTPVEVFGGSSAGRDIRAMPLPQISVQGAISDADSRNLPSHKELSPEAVKALGNIPARDEASLKRPRVIARDLSVPQAAGEEYALSLIVQGSFSAKNWEAAGTELARFLALPRTGDVKTRARFYLGQCNYFLRKPREALFEFLAIQDKYPDESMEWIQASLNMLRE